MSSTQAKPQKSARSARYFQVVMVCLISLAVYINTLPNGFVFDDNTQLVQNIWIRDFGHIPEIFRSNVWAFGGEVSNYYRPLMFVIYMLGYRLFGPAPWGFHLINVLINAAACVLVYLVTWRLLRDSGHDKDGASYVPLVTAVVFAVHPVHTEAVAWIAGVPDLSYALFCLLSLYFYMVSRGENGHATAAYVLSVTLYFAAMFCKEPAVVLPAVMFAYDYTVRKGKEGPSAYFKRYLPYAVSFAAFFIIRYMALGGFSPIPTRKMGIYQLAIDIPPLFGKYIGMALLPVNLNAFHLFYSVESVLSQAAISGMAVSALFAAALFVSLKRRSLYAVGLMLFAAPLLPALYIPGVWKNVFCERYMYLPVAGFALLAGLSYAQVSARMPGLKKVLGVFVVVFVAVYSAGTITRNAVWADDVTLWSDSVRKVPENPFAHLSLGTVYVKMGMLDEAIKENNLALSQPAADRYVHSLARSNIGSVYATRGQLDKAKEELAEVITNDPTNAEARCVLGSIYKKEGRMGEAVEELERAIKRNPLLPDAQSNLGIIYARQGKMEPALEHCRMAVELEPDNPEFHDNLGIVYSMAGKNMEAIEQFGYVLKIDPKNFKARNNLGMAYANMGRMDAAVEQFEAALEIDPGNAMLRENLRRAREGR